MTDDTERRASAPNSAAHTSPVGLTRRHLLAGVAALGLTARANDSRGFAPNTVEDVEASAHWQTDPATLTIASYGSPVDLDPHSAAEDRSALALRGPYEQLITLKDDKTDEYEAAIAERWEANDDQSVWTFHLRPGITFHDGSPCDAEAVRASFERLLTLDLGPGFELKRFITDPAQVTAPDAQTVVFDLGRPQPLFEAAVSAQYGGQIVNARLAREHEKDGDWGHQWAQLNTEGLGTGPYRITQFEPEQLVTLERFDGYWRGWDGPHFDRILIRVVAEPESRRQLIERGEADFADGLNPDALQAMEGNPDLIVNRSYSTQVDYLIMTVAGPLETPEARQAMCYAFPYDDVINGIYKGYGKRAIGPVAEACRGFAPGTFTYETDLDKARALFAEAGIAEGTQLTLTMRSDSADEAAMVQLFQANLAQLGIDLSIETVDYGTFTGILFRDVDAEEQPNLMPWGWWPAYNDAWDHLWAQVLCAAAGSLGANAGYYCNPRVDELLGEGRDAADPAAADKAYAEVQQILSRDDPPAIYYIQPQWPLVVRKEIAGFVFNPIYIGTFDFYRLHRGE
ncbi:MAG: ABC transporter substrate-binding protein [Thermomicrobiales bacterium]|nr:ABC transporter substrate-binding protein [Thermomicrobiales bacterium]